MLEMRTAGTLLVALAMNTCAGEEARVLESAVVASPGKEIARVSPVCDDGFPPISGELPVQSEASLYLDGVAHDVVMRLVLMFDGEALTSASFQVHEGPHSSRKLSGGFAITESLLATLPRQCLSLDGSSFLVLEDGIDSGNGVRELQMKSACVTLEAGGFVRIELGLLDSLQRAVPAVVRGSMRLECRYVIGQDGTTGFIEKRDGTLSSAPCSRVLSAAGLLRPGNSTGVDFPDMENELGTLR